MPAALIETAHLTKIYRTGDEELRALELGVADRAFVVKTGRAHALFFRHLRSSVGTHQPSLAL